MTAPAGWNLELTYAGLPPLFYERVEPTPVRRPRPVFYHRKLGLAVDPPPAAEIWTGNVLPPGCEPIAQAYAGHQYGHFTMLGDGRAILLGEQRSPGGELFDLQWKGAGPTPYSRRGDGRAALGPMLREVLISEAMHAFGIPTTRGLAVATTGEVVLRDRALPGAVLTRVASSHLRVGTFEYAGWRGGTEEVQALVDYTLRRHFPEEHARAAGENSAGVLLTALIHRQAKLIARWMHVGFVHGVMNTDNMAVSGETIDFGPCAFLEEYRAGAVFSSIDHHGRYAYGQQPQIAQWNLARFAESLLPLLPGAEGEAVEWATEAVRAFSSAFRAAWLAGARSRLGLWPSDDPAQDELDEKLYGQLLAWMEKSGADYTNTFAGLCAPGSIESLSGAELPGVDWADSELAQWHAQWKDRLAQQLRTEEESLALRRKTIPAMIPRNHLVEAALEAATESEDYGPFEELFKRLENPFDHVGTEAKWREPAPNGSEPYRTFCGT
jgi:serine/tyrosine/threonine adenylyltransferase